MHMGDMEIVIGLIFGLFGFIMAFFMRKSVNILIFTAFTYAAFKTLDRLDFRTDWASFNNFAYALSDLGSALLSVVSGLIGAASTFSLVLFIIGGVSGLLLKRKGA